MKRVKIVDDTLRRNVMTIVTPQMRLEALREGRSIPEIGHILRVIDHRRHQVQDVVKTEHVYEGARLEHAIRRAKRWMRGKRFPHDGAPRHIALAMAVFHKVYPLDFKEAVRVGGA